MASPGSPGPRASAIRPDALDELRRKLATGTETVVDPKTWSGSLPNQWGTAPMLRIGRSRWFNLVWLVPLGIALLVVGVAAAQALRELPSVQAFVAHRPLLRPALHHRALAASRPDELGLRPLRLRNEAEHGFKQVKWLAGIEFVRHFSEIGAGRGGYNQDHEFFGYRHAIDGARNDQRRRRSVRPTAVSA